MLTKQIKCCQEVNFKINYVCFGHEGFGKYGSASTAFMLTGFLGSVSIPLNISSIVVFFGPYCIFQFSSIQAVTASDNMVSTEHVGMLRSAEHSTALYYTALHCTALHCTSLHTLLYCIAMHCTALHFTAFHCNALHCTKLHYTYLYCTILY